MNVVFYFGNLLDEIDEVYLNSDASTCVNYVSFCALLRCVRIKGK